MEKFVAALLPRRRTRDRSYACSEQKTHQPGMLCAQCVRPTSAHLAPLHLIRSMRACGHVCDECCQVQLAGFAGVNVGCQCMQCIRAEHAPSQLHPRSRTGPGRCACFLAHLCAPPSGLHKYHRQVSSQDGCPVGGTEDAARDG